MEKQTIRALIATPTVLLLALGIAMAGASGAISRNGWPVLLLCAALAFAIQWVAFVPAYLKRTEHFYDLTGSLTYLSVIGLALWLVNEPSPRSLLLAGLVVVWALRLGSFLFLRIQRDGSDSRFDEIKHSAPRFFTAWTLQGLWVFLTLCAALASMTSVEQRPLGWVAAIGTTVWIFGFLVEVVADRQKRAFRSQPDNRHRFINTGLWSWSRHPNYFGEITLWLGVFIIAAPNLSGWQWLTVISPIFVWALLTKASGIPLLEKKSDEKWGDEPAYQNYKAATPELMLMPPRRSLDDA